MTLTAATVLRRLNVPSLSGICSRSSGLNAILRSMSVVTLSDESAVEKFRMINSKSILYFTATWCPPCKAIGPIYDEMSDRYPHIAFGKVDVDENSDAALDFEVNAVPTFVLFEGENAVSKFSGADPDKLAHHVLELEGR
mmetsp:Transcript_38640/g.78809  ORF Transcript_38640/g.78809 Transcript_38640/m.78809 type:complete len:140 (-) Transcript_38640:368-787(-)|eukprot:CAMPEP_0183306962 /NCGR_PEP_ID=MMETSP0160_2-20130417/15321_1 /TAXON_ID=2839 ORGANISM="Odontella Sinensis, Strain Grunow 1884" /NCGR_SAMPLE_ID=MMETSP0160_2 /ASSEMBLY_ACC=CAM_ASM_000250 /LENGTH=139 /DNA_ID=CAMNT_0025470445 /DNA_START=48 /DNA_END=467 /DNA_ORIENTATION=-